MEEKLSKLLVLIEEKKESKEEIMNLLFPNSKKVYTIKEQETITKNFFKNKQSALCAIREQSKMTYTEAFILYKLLLIFSSKQMENVDIFNLLLSQTDMTTKEFINNNTKFLIFPLDDFKDEIEKIIIKKNRSLKMEDRGFKKWQPFNSVASYSEILNNIPKSKADRPILSEEKKEELSNMIVDAYNSKKDVQITIYEKNSINTYNNINIEKLMPYNNTIYISNGKTVHFNQIIDIFED